MSMKRTSLKHLSNSRNPAEALLRLMLNNLAATAMGAFPLKSVQCDCPASDLAPHPVHSDGAEVCLKSVRERKEGSLLVTAMLGDETSLSMFSFRVILEDAAGLLQQTNSRGQGAC